MYPVCSKAEMLSALFEQGFPVPPLVFFKSSEWELRPEKCLTSIMAGPGAAKTALAVRSSALIEDGADFSQAGAFKSLLNIPLHSNDDLKAAIDEVCLSLPSAEDQIIVQSMVEKVIMSGVLMTRALDDGSPYYVINYDDTSGRTDTVTGGHGVSKTVHIHRGVLSADFDSPRLLKVVELVRSLEQVLAGEALDIEFAVDEELKVHLLQLRRICTVRHWQPDVEQGVNEHIAHVASFVKQLMTPRRNLYGKQSILGLMPDWNPAEMIGVHPRPLALSLYRELITRRTWSLAREMMGYRKMPPVELMVTIAGRPYIDVRASFNSFLPEGLPDEVAERLVDAWLERLNQNPSFHDKVEFEIVPTVIEPNFENIFNERYGRLLSTSELVEYRVRLTDLTAKAMGSGGTLDQALGSIQKLRAIQEINLAAERSQALELAEFDLSLRLAENLEQCRSLGTLPFAVIARHGFIAETWLRATINSGVLSQARVAALKRSIRTVSGELTRDFSLVLNRQISKEAFLHNYGHLRPGAYDILSSSYRDRADLFDVSPNAVKPLSEEPQFSFTENEHSQLEQLLAKSGLRISADAFLHYTRQAIAGREYAKFIFSRHLDHILFLAAAWGERLAFTAEDVSMLYIDDITSPTFQPLPMEGREFFIERRKSRSREYSLGRTFKLSYIIRSPRDVYIVPQHRSEPNFIGTKSVRAPVVNLDGLSDSGQHLGGSIVCIESADPGYDWIFTRDIAGLVTRYGGTNSHMAIRCAEYGLPAAIGCGDLIFESALKAEFLLLDCGAKTVCPINRPLVMADPWPAGNTFTGSYA